MSKIEALSIKEVDNLLKSNSGLSELIEYCERIFAQFDKIHYALKSRLITNGEQTDLYLDKVVGYVGFLRPIYESLEAHKKGESNAHYVNDYNKWEKEQEGKKTKEKEKFVSTVADRKASKFVQATRVLRNRVRGYVEQADKDMMILQSKLKYYSSGTGKKEGDD